MSNLSEIAPVILGNTPHEVDVLGIDMPLQGDNRRLQIIVVKSGEFFVKQHRVRDGEVDVLSEDLT